MSLYRSQLESVLRALSPPVQGEHTWFDQPIGQATLGLGVSDGMRAPALLAGLRDCLYSNFYVHGFARPIEAAPAMPVRPGRSQLARDLSAANHGGGYWQSGWTVQAIRDGRAVVSREGLLLSAPRADCRAAWGAIEPGSAVQLRLPREYLHLSPVFYMAAGDIDLFEGEPCTLVRLYWHTTPGGAVRLVDRCTRELNAAGVAFRLKTLNDAVFYTRCDAAVLYLRKDRYEPIQPLLRSIHAELGSELERDVPAFTKPLGHGLALAEDPGVPEGFGAHRCGLVAEALLSASAQGRRERDDVLDCVASRFAAAGITLDQPYLNPGSTDDYAFG